MEIGVTTLPSTALDLALAIEHFSVGNQWPGWDLVVWPLDVQKKGYTWYMIHTHIYIYTYTHTYNMYIYVCSYINTCMLLFKWRFDVAAEQYCVWMLIFVSGQFGRDAQSYCPCQLCLAMIGVWTKQLGYGHTRHFFKRFVTPIGLVWSTPKIGRDLPLTHKKSRWRLYLWPFPEGRLISNDLMQLFVCSK